MSLLSNFKAPKGKTFVEFDYAQLEIRVLAVASMDDTLISDINSGRDMHRYFASKIFSTPESEITKEQRKVSKGFSFQLQYGAGARSIADHWGVDISLAKKFIQEYTSRYGGVAAWQNSVEDYAKSTMDYRGDIDPDSNESMPSCLIPSIWTDSKTGRPVTHYRALADKSKWTEFGRALNVSTDRETYKVPRTRCKNFPIQGAASDIVMLMMSRLDKMSDDLRLINTVHDSFLALAEAAHVHTAIEGGVDILTSVPDVLKNTFHVASPVEFPVDYSHGGTLEEVKLKG